MAFTTDIANILGLNTNVNALNFGALVQKLENNDVFLKTSIEENYDTLANLFNKIGFQSQNAGYGSTAPNLSMFVDDQNKLIYKNNTGTLLDMEASISGEFDTIQVNTINDKDGGGITITSDVIIQGELNVGVWNATTIKDTEITDNIITLNKGEVGPGVTVTGNQSGIEIDRGSGVNKAQLFWDDSIDKWIFGINGSTDTIMGQNDIPITYNGIDAEYNDNGSLILKVQTNEGLEIRDAVENEPIASIFEAQGTPNSEGIFRLYENNQVYVELRGGASQPSYFNGGKVGIGTSSPVEKLEVSGAIKVGNASGTADGTIRWTGTDFEGRKSGSWVSLTEELLWVNNTNTIHYSGGKSVGINTHDLGNLCEFKWQGGTAQIAGGGLDISAGGVSLIIGADGSSTARTPTVDKVARMGAPHRLSSTQEPMAILFAKSDGTLNNSLYLGGGHGSFNAVTDFRIFTASNYTTLTGTERFRINNIGNVGIGGISTPARKVTIYENSSNEAFLQFTNSTTGTTVNDGAHIGLDNNEDLQISLLESGKLIEFYNNGIQAMVIDSSGNVGIGTSSPEIQQWRSNSKVLTVLAGSTSDGVGTLELGSQKADSDLEQHGVITFAATSQSGNHKHIAAIEAITNGSTANQRGGRLDFRVKQDGSTSDFTAMTLTEDGVGIGTNSPSSLLEVRTDSANTAYNGADSGLRDMVIRGSENVGLMIISKATSSTTYSSAATINFACDLSSGGVIGNSDETQHGFIKTVMETASEDASMHLGLKGIEYLSILDGGNVGIGTSSPDAKLDIDIGASNANGLLVTSDNNALVTGDHIKAVSGRGSTDAYNLLKLENSTGTQMIVQGDGKVGIGTSSPASATLLHVQGVIGTTNGTASAPTHSFYGDPDNGMYRSAVNELSFSTAGTQRLTIDSSGNVGIGTSSPSTAKLWISESDTTYSANTQSPLVVERAGNCFQQFLGGNTSQVGLLFGDNDFDVSWIVYDHNDDSMRFGTDAMERMRITADGHFYHGLQTGFGGTAVFRSNANTQYLAQGATSSEITLVVDNGVQSHNTSPKSGIGFAADRDGINHSTFAAIIGGKENGTFGNISGRLEFWVTRDLAQSGNNLQNRVWYINSSGHWLTENHNTQDIGTTSTRLRNVYVGTTVSAGSFTAGLDIPQGNGTLLHLHGGITNSYARFTNNTTGFTSTDGLLIGTSGSVSYLYNYEDHELNIRTGPSSPITFDIGFTERMRIDSSGKVGIGTSSPDALFEVQKDNDIAFDATQDDGQASGTATIRVSNQDGTQNSFSQILFDTAGTNQSIARIAAIRTTNSTNDLAFAVENANTKFEAMRIKGNGNVGIGTTGPQTKLHISHGETSVVGPQEVLRLQGDWNGSSGVDGDGALIRFTNQHNSATNPNTGEYNVAGIAGLDDSSSWGGSLHFQTSPTGGTGGNDLQTRMVVRYDGKVGIGTTAPTAPLHVRSNDDAILILQSNDSTTGSAYLEIFDSADASKGFLGYGSTGDDNLSIWNREVSNLRFATSNSEKMRLTSTGSLGVGTTAPAEKLEVSGAIKLGTTSSTNAGTIRWSGSDFEGYDGASWQSFTNESVSSQWTTSGSNIYYNTGNVGIGTSSPGSFSSAGNNLVVGSGSGDEGLTIYSGSSNGGKIYFADGTSGDQAYRGWVTYEHYTDALQFGTNASTKMVIDSNGILTIKDSTNQAPSISNFEIHDNSRTTMRLYNTKHHGSLVANATIGDYYIDYDVSTSGIIRRTAASWSALYEYVSGTQKNIKVSFFANARDTGAATRIGKFLFQGTEGSTIHDIMTITAESGGRVGIGTTSPSNPLEVREDGTTTPKILVRSVSNGDPTISFLSDSKQFTMGIDDTSNGFVISEGSGLGSSDRFVITADGKVGIGTSSPGAILNIAIPDGSNIGTLYTSKRSYNDSANRVDLVYQYEYNSSGSFTAGSRISFAKEGFTDGHYGSDIRFSTRENGTPPTEKMRILGNGKVGIGTSAPNARLDVVGQTPSTLTSSANVIGVSGGTQGRFYVAGSNQAGMIQEDTGATSNNKVTQLVTYGDTFRIVNLTDVYGTKSTSILVDKSTGFVGINKTSASVALDVNGEILSNSQIRITNTGQARLVADAGAITFANDSSLDTVITTSGLERMRILAGGFVGIGTAGFSPTTKLHVHESTSASCYAKFTNQATGNTASDGLLVGVNGSFGNPLIWSYENVNLWFATNNARRMELRADGALAMCSQNSQVQTGILQTRNTDEFAIRYNSYHDGSNDRIITGGTTAASAMVMDNNGTFRFLNIPQGSLSNGQTFSYTERMRIDSSGRVAIGTSDTTTHLDGVSGLTIYDSYSAGIALANSSRGYLMYTSGANLSFWDSTANAIRMYLTSSGHFGIGTSNPQRMLHVQRTSSNAFISVTTNTYQIAGINFGDTQSDSRGGIWYINNTETMVFRTNAGTRWSIDSNGHLDPNGGGTYDIGDTNNRVRTIYSNNALNTSDYNLKKDFTVFNSSNQIDQAVNAIMDTDMVLYRFGHEDASKTNQTLGFVLNDTRENGYFTDPFFKARKDDQSYNIMHVVGTLMAANKRAYSIIQQLVKIVKDNNLDTQSLPLDDMIPQD